MVTRFSLPLLVFIAACFSFVAGCGQTEQKPAGDNASVAEGGDDDYNPHDVPITEEQKAQLRNQAAKYADAVAKVKQFRNEVEQETAAGIPENPYQAHQALDQADLVLQWLPEIGTIRAWPRRIGKPSTRQPMNYERSSRKSIRILITNRTRTLPPWPSRSTRSWRVSSRSPLHPHRINRCAP